jgi:hypothetical protein
MAAAMAEAGKALAREHSRSRIAERLVKVIEAVARDGAAAAPRPSDQGS